MLFFGDYCHLYPPCPKAQLGIFLFLIMRLQKRKKRGLTLLLVCSFRPWDLPCVLTSRVSAHASICTYPEKCAWGHNLPSQHTPEYNYSIPVAFTSDIAIDTHFEFLRFKEANRQSIDDAFTLCSVPPITLTSVRCPPSSSLTLKPRSHESTAWVWTWQRYTFPTE